MPGLFFSSEAVLPYFALIESYLQNGWLPCQAFMRPEPQAHWKLGSIRLYKAMQLIRYWELYSCITRLLCQGYWALLHCIVTWRICFCLSAQFDGCQPSLAVWVCSHKWHGIAGYSTSAPNKPLPSQKIDLAFETKYSTVFSISNNMVQHFSGNLMTCSSDCLRICCNAAAQTAVGV